MQGLIIKKAHLVHEDERRSLLEICNGEVGFRNLKILHVKAGGQILGNHWHTYPEVMYVMKGRGEYKLKHVITGETEELVVEEGDVMIKTGFITHTGMFTEDSIIVDASSETYIDPKFNDVIDKIWTK